MLQKIYFKTKQTRTEAIVLSLASLVTIFIISLSISLLLEKTEWTELSSGKLMSAIILLIIEIISLIVLLFALISRSIEEKEIKEVRVRLAIKSELQSVMQKIYGSICRDFSSNEYFRKICENSLIDIEKNFSPGHLDKASLKILLNGISNNLAVIYYLLDCREKKNDNIIRIKLEDWEEEIKNSRKFSELYTKAKNSLHELYQRIEQYALKNEVEIVQIESKMKYLIYADASILSYIDRLKNQLKNMKK